MARPKKKTVDYFPHICKSGKTIVILESRFGNDGYAFWFKLLEILATTDGHCFLADNPTNWEFLLAKTHVDNDKATEIINLLVLLEAIDNELWLSHKAIWCDKLVENIADAYRNRTTPLPQKPSYDGSKPDGPGITNEENSLSLRVISTTNTQTKLKETKLKETKLNTSAFETFWKAYPKKKSKGQAEKTFNKINPDEQLLATILLKIEQAGKSINWLKEDGQYIPYPATWLNAKGWEDEYSEAELNGTHKAGIGKISGKPAKDKWGREPNDPNYGRIPIEEFEYSG